MIIINLSRDSNAAAAVVVAAAAVAAAAAALAATIVVVAAEPVAAAAVAAAAVSAALETVTIILFPWVSEIMPSESPCRTYPNRHRCFFPEIFFASPSSRLPRFLFYSFPKYFELGFPKCRALRRKYRE